MDPSGFSIFFEPETPALQGQCSTTELRAHVSIMCMRIGVN